MGPSSNAQEDQFYLISNKGDAVIFSKLEASYHSSVLKDWSSGGLTREQLKTFTKGHSGKSDLIIDFTTDELRALKKFFTVNCTICKPGVVEDLPRFWIEYMRQLESHHDIDKCSWFQMAAFFDIPELRDIAEKCCSKAWLR